MGKIIIDCDPGHDDAVALLLAVRSGLPILGVTTVAGNSSLEHTTRNALRILAFAGAGNIPVYAGYEKPLKRELFNNSGAKIHGEDGLGNLTIQSAAPKPRQQHAADFLIRSLTECRDKITLVCLGPLTNVAQAFLKEPKCRENVEKLVIMGGAVYAPGNVNSAAEFNFFIDPEAADVVLSSGCAIDLTPLDVTMNALFFPKDIERLERSRDRLANLAGRLLRLYAGTYEAELGYLACPVHDALCVGVLIKPSLVAYEKMAVKISVDGITAGESVADFSGSWKENVRLGRTVDREGFVALVEGTLAGSGRALE